MNKRKICSSLLTASILVTALPFAVAVKADQIPSYSTYSVVEKTPIDAEYVPIDEVNFPDSAFREFVAEYDGNNDNRLSIEERNSLVNFYDYNVMGYCSSYSGIEYFQNLESFTVYYNSSLNDLDVSQNVNLKTLRIYAGNLGHIDLSENTELKELSLSKLNLLYLDLSNNEKLESLELSCAYLGGVNLNNCTNLINISLEAQNDYGVHTVSHIGEIDLSSLNNVKILNISGVIIDDFTFGFHRNLESLTIDNIYNFSVTDFTGCENLTQLSVTGCGITTIEAPESITILNVSSNVLETLDVSKYTELTSLSCGDNNLSSLDVSNNTKLERLECDGNEITSLDLKNNNSLKYLYCYDNNINSLDLTNNTELIYLTCNNNNLSSLDLSSNSQLTYVSCYDNNIDTLDFSNCPYMCELLNNATESINNNSGHLALTYWRYSSFGVVNLYCDYDVTLIPDCLGILPAESEEGRIEIDNPDNFNDPVFIEYIKSNFDVNNDGYLSQREIAGVTSLYLYDVGNIDGAEIFYNITSLNVSGGIDSVDLSSFNKLRFLYLDNNIRYVDISNNPELIDVMTNYSSYEIEIPRVLFRKDLNSQLCVFVNANIMANGVEMNPYVDYEVPDNVVIDEAFPDPTFNNYVHTYVDRDNDGILTLNELSDIHYLPFNSGGSDFIIHDMTGVNNFFNITYLELCNNDIESLSLDLPKLENLYLRYSNVSYLDISGCPNLINLKCENNNIRTIDISNNEYLQMFVEDNGCGVYCGQFYDENYGSLHEVTFITDGGVKLIFDGAPEYVERSVNVEETFSDINFRNYISEYIDLDGNGILDNYELGIKSIDCYGWNIESLDGIEEFTFLRELRCSYNDLTSLDVSGLPYLMVLSCDHNNLSELDVSNNPDLYYLNCSNTKIYSLDISNNDTLISLFMSTGYDGNGSWYRRDYIYGDYMDFGLHTNSYIEIIFEGAPSMPSYDGVEPVVINSDSFTNPVILEYVRNEIDDGDGVLSVPEILSVRDINLYDRELTNLDGIDIFVNIIYLDCSNNSITSLDLSNFTKLQILSCGNNRLTNLDISSNPNLRSLNCTNNNFTVLDITNNSSLIEAFMTTGYEGMGGWSYDFYTDGTTFSYTLFTSPSMQFVFDGVPDFNLFDGFEAVTIDENTFPDVNFRNFILEVIDTSEEPGVLTPFEIYNVINIDCRERNISDLTGIGVFKRLQFLDCGYNNLTSLDVSNNNDLYTLWCEGNQLSSIVYSEENHVNSLNIDCNEFSEFDFNAFSELVNLYCGGNRFDTIDISGLRLLSDFNCSDNNLIELDLSNLSELRQLYCKGNDFDILNINNNPYLICAFNSDGYSNMDYSWTNYSDDYLYCHLETDPFITIEFDGAPEAPIHVHNIVHEERREPDCCNPGYEAYDYCYDCGRILTEYIEIPQLEHELETTFAIAPTEHMWGVTEGSRCINCGSIINQQEVVPALDGTIPMQLPDTFSVGDTVTIYPIVEYDYYMDLVVNESGYYRFNVTENNNSIYFYVCNETYMGLDYDFSIVDDNPCYGYYLTAGEVYYVHIGIDRYESYSIPTSLSLEYFTERPICQHEDTYCTGFDALYHHIYCNSCGDYLGIERHYSDNMDIIPMSGVYNCVSFVCVCGNQCSYYEATVEPVVMSLGSQVDYVSNSTNNDGSMLLAFTPDISGTYNFLSSDDYSFNSEIYSLYDTSMYREGTNYYGSNLSFVSLEAGTTYYFVIKQYEGYQAGTDYYFWIEYNNPSTIVGYSVTLDGTIGLNYYLDFSEDFMNDSESYVSFVIDDEVVWSGVPSNGTWDEEKQAYRFTCQVDAKELTSNVTCVVSGNYGYNMAYSYSLEDYISDIRSNSDMNGEYTEALGIVNALEAYGSCAQEFFDYRSWERPWFDVDLGSVSAETLAQYAEYSYEQGEGVVLVGGNLDLLSTTTLRLYFTIDSSIDPNSVTISDGINTYGIFNDNGYYFIEISGIRSYELSKVYSLSVSVDGVEIEIVQYSPMTYCYNVLNYPTDGGITDSLKELVRSLYVYSSEADAYFAGRG